MPDFQIDERERQARLTGRFVAARDREVVERHTCTCPPSTGAAVLKPISSKCRKCGKRIANDTQLSWIEFRDLAVAGDGRYTVRKVKTGWIATAYQDGIERLSPVMTEVLCREWAEAREMDRRLSETAKHEALDVSYEVGGES